MPKFATTALCILLLCLAIAALFWGLDYFVGPGSDPVYNGRPPSHHTLENSYNVSEGEDGTFTIKEKHKPGTWY